LKHKICHKKGSTFFDCTFFLDICVDF